MYYKDALRPLMPENKLRNPPLLFDNFKYNQVNLRKVCIIIIIFNEYQECIDIEYQTARFMKSIDSDQTALSAYGFNSFGSGPTAYYM